MDMLPGEDIPPEQSRERSAECRAKRAIVDSKSHGVDRGPEGPIGDEGTVSLVDAHPGLDDAGEEDGGSDVGA